MQVDRQLHLSLQQIYSVFLVAHPTEKHSSLPTFNPFQKEEWKKIPQILWQ